MKKKMTWPAMIVLAMVMVGGCSSGLEKVPANGEVTLFFFVEAEVGTRAVLNPGKDPVYRRVEVNGTGPAGGSFTLASVEPGCTVSDLATGLWQLEARAFSPQEEVIAGFEGSISIGDRDLRHDILFVPLGKKSTLNAEITWDPEIFSNPEIELGTLAGGEVPLTTESDHASGAIEVESGITILKLSFESDQGAAGGIFPFFAGPGMEFSLRIELSLSEGQELPMVTWDFEPLQLTEEELEIAGSGPPFFVGREESFSLMDVPVDGAEAGAGVLRWFLEDEEIGAGPSVGIEAGEAGLKTITAVLTGDAPLTVDRVARVARGSMPVRFRLPYRVGPTVFFQQIDGPEGLRGLACSPDGGYVTAAGYSEDSLVLWRRDSESGGLELLVETGAETASLLDGISDTAFSPAGNLLAAASKNSSSLLLWDLGDQEEDDSENLVGPDGFLAPAKALRASDPGLECLDGVSALAFSEDGAFLYAAASGSDSLAVFEVTGGGIELLQVLDAAGIGSELFDGPADIALSGSGNDGGGVPVVSDDDDGTGIPAAVWAAVPCLDGDSLFIFYRDGESGLLNTEPAGIFSDGVDGAELLNGVHRVTFYENHLYSSSYYDDGVCLFEWVPDSTGTDYPDSGDPDFSDPPDAEAGTWEYRGAWDSFDVGPGGTSGICPEVPVGDLEYSQEIAVSPDGALLALAAAGNDGVCIFSRDGLDGGLTPLAAAVDGTTGLSGLEGSSGGPSDPLEGFDGARSVVWSPDGKNLYCAASNSDRLTVFQEW